MSIANLFSRSLHQQAVFLLGMLLTASVHAVSPGTTVSNTATASFGSAGTPVVTTGSVSFTTRVSTTPGTIEFLQYDPTGANTSYSVGQTQYSNDGTTLAGVFGPSPAPTDVRGNALGAPGAVSLAPASSYKSGESIFIRVVDPDPNTDPAAIDYLFVTVTVAETGDSEVLRLVETGPNTGEFIGYVQSSLGSATQNDGLLAVASGATLTARYTDRFDGSDATSIAALVDPFGVVFNTETGERVNGAQVTIVDMNTGKPATVFGDDGVSSYPSTVTSGGRATDGAGNVYNFGNGEYRFPYVNPGRYRIDVVTPAGYSYPSTAATPKIQTLPGAPYAIVTGSRNEVFVLVPGPALQIDLPVDPVQVRLVIEKKASRGVVSVGDFLQYTLTITNPNKSYGVSGVTMHDRLPVGFRYEKGSASLDGVKVANPAIAGNGRDLSFAIGTVPAGAVQTLKYVVQVAAGAGIGKATNTASASRNGQPVSNTATETVQVKNELMRDSAILMGSVHLLDGQSGANAGDIANSNAVVAGGAGVAGVKLYLEDGTSVITDSEGRWHIEGVRPGSHVIQLDTASLTEHELKPCEDDSSRKAGSSISRFVDVQGGSIWQEDFCVVKKAPPPRVVSKTLNVKVADGLAHYEVTLQGPAAAIKNLTTVVMLPEGGKYVPGSATLDGKAMDDPDKPGQMLTWRLGDNSGVLKKALSFDVRLKGAAAGQESKSFSSFKVADKSVRVPLITVPLDKDGASAQASAPLPAVAAKTDDGAKGFDIDALLAGSAPGFEWMQPAEGFNPRIPAIRLVVKHDPAHKLTLRLNGEEVSLLNFYGMKKGANGKVAISHWKGVDIRDGDNLFELVVSDRQGKHIRTETRQVHYSGSPVKAELVPAQSTLVADGKNPIVVAVRLIDEDGFPVRMGVSSRLNIKPPFSWYDKTRVSEADKLLDRGEHSEPLYRVSGDDGVALIELTPTTTTGEAVLEFEYNNGKKQEIRAWVKPAVRDWIIVGIAEGTLLHRNISGNRESLNASEREDRLYRDGRIAFFAKGKIKGEYLLTVAYDTAKRSDDQAVGGGLTQQIDPDEYYTLYGDASQQQHEAASTRKLYLKIEREQFYAMFGDFLTGLDVTELSRYSRSLNGFKSEYRGETLRYNAFATTTSQGYVRDEIRGDGTSGLYQLSRSDLLENSEKVTLEVRDRFHSEVIVSSRSLKRHFDYDIDYDDGTLYFHEPISHRDADLNPQFIVVEYEFDGEGDEKPVYGGRVGVAMLDDRAEIGVSHIHEGTVGARTDLVGADLRYDISENTQLKMEVATSSSERTNTESRGDAWLAELTHEGEKLSARAYAREQDAGFGLGQQNASEGGMRKIGGDLQYKLNEQVSLNGQAYTQKNLATGARRDVVEGRAEYAQDGSRYYLGARDSKDHTGAGESLGSTQLLAGASKTFMDGRLNLRADAETTLSSRKDNPDFPNRIVLGADYRLTEKYALFAEQEFTDGTDEDTQTTRVGMRSEPWAGATSLTALEQQQQPDGVRLVMTSAFNQRWQINEEWSVDAGMDRSVTMKDERQAPALNINTPPASGNRTEDFTAVSAGVAWHKDDWSFSSRAELRNGDNSDKLNLSAGIHRELAEGIALAATADVHKTRSDNGDKHSGLDLRLSYAFRPRDSKWVVLNRLDYIHDDEQSLTSRIKTRKLVNNLNANYRYDSKTQLALQYGAKYVFDTIDGDSYTGYTDLIGAEVRRDIGKQWDVGAHASVLHSWRADNYDASYGVSVGYSPMKNTWISLGYNFDGFRDEDFDGSEYTAEGIFLKFRYKFDQDALKPKQAGERGLFDGLGK